MGYTADPLYRLGIAARNVGVVIAGMSVALLLVAVYDPDGVADPKSRTGFYITYFGIVPATFMVILSFPARRGHLWAAISLFVVCLWQLPALLLFSRSCCTVWLPAYFIARCVIAWPEIVFQVRAARRQRRGYGGGHGLEPIMNPDATAAVAQAPAGAPLPHSTPQPPPRALKPGTRRQDP